MIAPPIAPKTDQDQVPADLINAIKAAHASSSKQDSNEVPADLINAIKGIKPAQAPVPELPTQGDKGPIFGATGTPSVDYVHLLNDAVGQAQTRLPAVIQANSGKAIRDMEHQDLLGSLQQLQQMSQPGAGSEAAGQIQPNGGNKGFQQAFNNWVFDPNSGSNMLQQGPKVFQQGQNDIQQKRQEILTNAVDPFTGTYAQIQNNLANGDAATHARLIKTIKRNNPAIANQIDKDSYLLSAKDRPQNAAQIIQNAKGIENGDLAFNHSSQTVVNPQGFWGSLGSGWNRMQKEYIGYDEYANGTPEENIKKLELERAQKNPDKPIDVPEGVLGFGGNMVGGNGLQIGGQFAIDALTAAVGVPGAAPFVNAALFSKDTHDRAWYNYYTNTYNHLRDKGNTTQDSEREARNQADYDAKADMVRAGATALIGGKIGGSEVATASRAASEAFNESISNVANDLGTDMGQTFHVTGPPSATEFSPEFQTAATKVLQKVANSNSQLAQKIALQGGVNGALATMTQGLKNIHDGKPWDNDMAQEFWSNFGMTALLGAGGAVLGRLNNGKTPEESPTSSEMALPEATPGDENFKPTLTIETPNAPKLIRPSQSDLIEQAQEEIDKGSIQGLSKGPYEDIAKNHPKQIPTVLKEIADQAHDPESAEGAAKTYGQRLVDIAKQMHPLNSAEEDELDQKAADALNEKLQKTSTYGGKPNLTVAELKDQFPVDFDYYRKGLDNQAAAGTSEPIAEADPTKPVVDQITPTTNITSLQNAITAAKRTALGMSDAAQAAHKEFGQSWQDGMNGIENGTIKPDALITQALGGKPKPWSDAENAAVLKTQIDKETELRQLNEDINNLPTDDNAGKLDELKAQKAQIQDQLQDIYTAGRRAGTENARGLNTRKMMADDNYSLGAMLSAKQSANDGKPLTTEQKTDVQDQFDQIQEAKDRRDKMAAPGFTAQQTAPPNVAIQANAQVQNLQNNFTQSVTTINKTQLQKATDAFINWQREFKLSNPVTLAKLGMAGVTRIATNPLEGAIGGALTKILPKALTKNATSEAGFYAKQEAKSITEGFMYGLKDAGDLWEKGGKGQTALTALKGKAPMNEDGINFFGRVHQTIKAPVKRIAFERSWRNQAENAIANGINPTDPAVMAKMTITALKDADRSIFMQDNLVSKWWNGGVQALERQGTGGQVAGKAMRWLVPFVKVPTNIIGETGNYTAGSLIGTSRLLYHAINGSLKGLSEDEANSIVRNLKKGALGSAMLTLGYMKPDNFGGLYQPGEKKGEGDPGFMEAEIGGVKIPRWLLEAPIFQTAQIGATLRHAMDMRTKGGETDIPNSVMATALGLTAEEPLVPSEVGKLFGRDQERSQFINQWIKGTVDPAILQQAARWQDGGQKYKPQNPWQAIESGIPFLNSNVPTSNPAKSNIPISGHQ